MTALTMPSAGTKRNALDLWSLPWSFTQQGLLSPDAFERECDVRGLAMLSGQLEALDRAGVLRPVFEIDDHVMSGGIRSGTRVVRAALTDGGIRNRLANPEAEWPYGYGSQVTVMYSPYQLLAIPALRQFVSNLKLEQSVGPDDPLRWTFADQKIEFIAQGRRLPLVEEEVIVWLSFLEPVFLPRVLKQISLPFPGELPEDRTYTAEELAEVDQEHRRAFDEYRWKVPMGELLQWMQATPEQLAGYVERLLRAADSMDPLGGWLQVVRLAPHRWKLLQREALVALDQRIAAEILLQFLHELAKEAKADPTVYGNEGSLAIRFAESRLASDDRKREGVLVDFDLSPYPISLVVIEGKTEQVMAARVITELELPLPPWPVRLHNGRSVDSDLKWLYRYAWAFDIHEEIPGGFRPSRPLPFIFVLADPEGSLGTPALRKAHRDKIIRHLKADAAEVAGRALPDDVFDSRAQVLTWPKSFEFSHFSAEELATAIRSIEPALDSRLEAEIAREEVAPQPRIGSVWHRLREAGLVHRDIDKPAIAEALWPALQWKIQATRGDGARLREIPFVAALLDAYSPVFEYPWGHFSYVAAGKRS